MKFLWLTLLVLVSCTKSEKKTARNEFNYALTSNVSTLDPAVSYDTVSAKVVYQIHESMYEYDYLVRPYQLKPLLAKELPLIENKGLTYTIKLKKNIKYHDHEAFGGKKRFVIAEDFINQIKRLALKSTRSSGWWLFDGKVKGLNEFREKAGNDFNNIFNMKVEGLKALDDHTLQFKLTQPYPQLLYTLGMAFTSPIPKEIITYFKNDLTQFAVGTGPYKLNTWKKNSIIKLERNDDYHESYYPSKGDRFTNEKKLLTDSGKKLPFIDKINFHIIKEAHTRWLNFNSKKNRFNCFN